MNEIEPHIQAILNPMSQSMRSVPPAIANAAAVDSQMVLEQVHSSAFTMPPEGGARDPETRTLIYLGAALASSNHACTQADGR
jgi:hypothetical protein